MSKLSIIVPAYNEEKSINKTAEVISGLMVNAGIDYELLFINDGSKDNTWLEIMWQAESNKNIKGVSFSRNFGKEAAIFAGLDNCIGNCAVVIDCDLQHPPEKIVEMYKLWEEGYEVVEGVKNSRGNESAIHKFVVGIFYKIMSNITNIDMKNASDFKLMDRKVIETLKSMPERNTFFRALSSWCGFKSTKLFFDVREREEGESKWSTKSLVKYALNNITSFSVLPMQIVTFFGAFFFLFAVILGIQSIVYKIIGRALEGFTTVICIELLVGSICMINMGIMGVYIAKMYEEIKGRPRYIAASKVNIEQNENN
jgi:glycosyltransferase involved in cell wall biosynthesis